MIKMSTRYDEMVLGDVFPDGGIVVRVETSGGIERCAVKITTRKSNIDTTFAQCWGYETYGASMARAVFMRDLPN